MFLEVGIIVAGIPFGWALKKNEKIKQVVGNLSTYTVYALLFFLGIQIGANEEVMASLGELGLKSLIFGLSISLGSILAGIGIHRYLKGLQD